MGFIWVGIEKVMFESIGDRSWDVMYEARGFRIGRAGSSKYVIFFLN